MSAEFLPLWARRGISISSMAASCSCVVKLAKRLQSAYDFLQTILPFSTSRSRTRTMSKRSRRPWKPRARFSKSMKMASDRSSVVTMVPRDSGKYGLSPGAGAERQLDPKFKRLARHLSPGLPLRVGQPREGFLGGHLAFDPHRAVRLQYLAGGQKGPVLRQRVGRIIHDFDDLALELVGDLLDVVVLLVREVEPFLDVRLIQGDDPVDLDLD